MQALHLSKLFWPTGPRVADLNAERLEVAMRSGASGVYKPGSKEDLKRLHADTNGGVDVVLDFVGSESSVAFATSACKSHEGVVIVVGLYGGAGIPVSMFPLKALTMQGSLVGSFDEFKELLQLAAQHKMTGTGLLEKPLPEAEQVVKDLKSGKIPGRAILRPQGASAL
eukprot:TRINITY_DN1724_c0_g1_i2.p1 TRINITY_DN1724_c0_g1~~TRINITY_DN1724_c0_g1_i2.p1  ORF type:complete len:169 (+),score=27.61 TRINITY_DN1724_c0_g1_i2:121-627(+)